MKQIFSSLYPNNSVTTGINKSKSNSHCSLFTNHVVEQFYLTGFHQSENKIQ